jgi:hypothetical protein
MAKASARVLERLTTIDDDWRPRYGLVLVLVSATFLSLSALPSTNWAVAVSLILQAATLLFTLRTSRARPWLMRLAIAATLLFALGSMALVVATVSDSFAAEARGGGFLTTALIAAVAILAIGAGVIRYVAARGAVTVEALTGGLSIYLLFGILFAVVYGAVGSVQADPFFTNGTDGNSQDHIYFSFVTLTTLGYGDLAPAQEVGRTLATVEALVGQIYLVAVIGVIVGNLGRGVRPGNER